MPPPKPAEKEAERLAPRDQKREREKVELVRRPQALLRIAELSWARNRPASSWQKAGSSSAISGAAAPVASAAVGSKSTVGL